MSQAAFYENRREYRHSVFGANDNRVRALTAELDELRSKYDAALIRLRTDRPDFPRDVEQFLASEAKARNMTVTMLMRAIVEAVVEDNLFAALLDG